jgi:hypothetical protein
LISWNPALALRNSLDRGGERGFDESGKPCLDADRRRFSPLERHDSHQAHWRRQLDIAVPAVVSIDEILQEKRHIAALQIATHPQFLGVVRRYVLRPSLNGVEGDDAVRALIGR